MTEADEIFPKVKKILYRSQGIRPEEVTWTSDLRCDHEIAGDDAEDLFMEIDKSFAVDWGDLYLPIHFDHEGGLSPPWFMDEYLYKHQPFRVCDLVTGLPPLPRGILYGIKALSQNAGQM